jgi:hypothetical protein
LSDVKVGKKTPLTQTHFDELLQLLPSRATGVRSWTLDFANRLQKSLDESRAQLRGQMRKRLGNQAPDRGK